MTPGELAPRFFIAVVVILLFCKVVAWTLAWAGQPAVVSEMLAGVLLGPSLLGLLFPDAQDAVFPHELYPVLYIVGQVGLVIFMFQAGHAFARHQVPKLLGTAGAVSLAGVAAPLALGVLVVVTTSTRVPIRAEGIPTAVTAAFVGVALAITAFPMLARIITERGQAGTRHGTLALASGAIDDAAAWIMMAFVVAAASGELGPALVTLGGTAFFVVLLRFGARPVSRVLMTHPRIGPQEQILGTVALLFAIAWYTDGIGLYAVFGAFAVGVVMPQNERSEAVIGTLTPISQHVFLPLFFTYSGLHTEFGLLGDSSVLLFAAGCVACAVAGKFGACWAAARLRGEPNGVALRVGALMNARGLMQLIALNIGLEEGIVTPSLFSALVLVALVTTLMTTPLLTLVERRDPEAGQNGGLCASYSGHPRFAVGRSPAARESACPASPAPERGHGRGGSR